MRTPTLIAMIALVVMIVIDIQDGNGIAMLQVLTTIIIGKPG